jgi:hypothetical protein
MDGLNQTMDAVEQGAMFGGDSVYVDLSCFIDCELGCHGASFSLDPVAGQRVRARADGAEHLDPP